MKTIFFDVGYTLVNEDAVWERRCKEQAETEEAKRLGVSAEDIYHEIEKKNPPDYEVENLTELLKIF